MKREAISIQMEAEKLRAVKRYMEKKDADLTQELGDALQKLYEKYVPATVREYIDESSEAAPVPAKKPKEKSKMLAAAQNSSETAFP